MLTSSVVVSTARLRSLFHDAMFPECTVILSASCRTASGALSELEWSGSNREGCAMLTNAAITVLHYGSYESGTCFMHAEPVPGPRACHRFSKNTRILAALINYAHPVRGTMYVHSTYMHIVHTRTPAYIVIVIKSIYKVVI